MKGCAYKGCDKAHHGRGLCKVHYTKEHQAHKRNRRCRGDNCERYARHGSLCAQCHQLKKCEVVLNDALRERYLELSRKEDSTGEVGSGVCWYMHANGFKSYVKVGDRGDHSNSGHLKRRLGLSRLSGSVKKGRVYEAGFKTVLPYEEAVALSRALGMAPYEAGV